MIKIREPKFYIGIIIFAIVIVLSLFVAAPLQYALKIWGLALTELIILLCAVVPVFLLKWNIKEVFPIKTPKFRPLFGTFVFWYGTNISVTVITLVLTYFFPEAMSARTYGISSFFTGIPLIVSLFVAAVLPCTCEEALHRGFIFYTFQNVNNKWLKIIAIGIIFGIFHLDFYRFLPTAVMGVLLTYIMYETNNMIYPMLFHFINNALSVFATVVTATLTEALTMQAMMIQPVQIGLYLMISAAVPFLFIGASKLIKPLVNGISVKTSKKAMTTAVIVSVIAFIAGLSIFAVSIVRQLPLLLDKGIL